MVKYENECVDCGLPCLGNSCPNRNVVRYYCDGCGEECNTYIFDDEELCIDCIELRLDRVSNYD